jgi:hypothetical protein
MLLGKVKLGYLILAGHKTAFPQNPAIFLPSLSPPGSNHSMLFTESSLTTGLYTALNK